MIILCLTYSTLGYYLPLLLSKNYSLCKDSFEPNHFFLFFNFQIIVLSQACSTEKITTCTKNIESIFHFYFYFLEKRKMSLCSRNICTIISSIQEKDSIKELRTDQ